MFFQSIITSLSFPKNTTLPNIPHFVNALFINSLPSTSDTQGFSATTQSLPPFPRKPFKTPSWICYQYISLPLLKRFRLTNYFFLSTTQYNAVIVPIKSPNGLPRWYFCVNELSRLFFFRSSVIFETHHSYASNKPQVKLKALPYIQRTPGLWRVWGSWGGRFLENSLEFSFSCKYLAHTGVHRNICLFIR